MNDQTEKIYIILLITFHHCTIEKLKEKIVDLRPGHIDTEIDFVSGNVRGD